MREKELRLALICYGGISLAVYMHGITKEIWHLVRASRNHISCKGDTPDTLGGSAKIYAELLEIIETDCNMRLRILPDIIAGASAGGINGIFLAQAISSGQSLEPLTQLWLNNADIEDLLAPEARASSSLYHALAMPIARRLIGEKNATLDATVSPEAREEVQRKLAHFVRSRWFAPPFGGPKFTNIMLDAFEAMAKSPASPRLLPKGQPLDLFVTVTDFYGHKEQLKLNSPTEISETEHRLTISFQDKGNGLGESPSLAFAARATASFPGAFPPFSVTELDTVLHERDMAWLERDVFLKRTLPRDGTPPEAVMMIDGSVLTNAPFKPAIAALKDRPARREIDRRFVYIDPTPGGAAIGVRVMNGGGNGSGAARREAVPGFFTTIISAVSGIPREQPIHDNLEELEARSRQIERTNRIIESLQSEVESEIERLLGNMLFLNRPTPARLIQWRAKAHVQAVQKAGYAYAAYGHLKKSGIIENYVQLLARSGARQDRDALRIFLHNDSPSNELSKAADVEFFRTHDLKFRIRRLRFVARRLEAMSDSENAEVIGKLRTTIFTELSKYLDREILGFYQGISVNDPSIALEDIGARLNLSAIDDQTDDALALALNECPKDVRRAALLAYLGFPFYDIVTLPLLQGDGGGEFDPIRVDRIAPDDATTIRSGGANTTLRGIEFHNFGAFFSRAYRENDYLWGRLHGVDRLIDITISTLPKAALSANTVRQFKLRAFRAILAEERERLTAIPDIFAALDQELAELEG